MLISQISMVTKMIEVLTAIILSLLAGLATGLGGLIVLVKSPSKKMMSFLMGLAAGIMIILSFLELMVEALNLAGLFLAATGFLAGSISLFILDSLLPHLHFGTKENGLVDLKLFRYSTLIAVGIALHNFPEGIAVGSSYAYLPELGLTVAIAMAIHNIPEGMAIAIPACLSGCSKVSALRLAFFSGLAEPAGALVSVLLLGAFNGFVPFGLAFAAGIMVFITLDEIIPAANQNGHEHFTSSGIIVGSLLTFVLLGFLL
jgi:ZIP family zinc transporter